MSDLSDTSRSLLLAFAEFLDSEGTTASTFFKEVEYFQLIKKKGKIKIVYLVSADDFFRLLEENGEIMAGYTFTSGVKEELQSLLCLDPHYKELLIVKKIQKYLTEVKTI